MHVVESYVFSARYQDLYLIATARRALQIRNRDVWFAVKYEYYSIAQSLHKLGPLFLEQWGLDWTET
jgi:hypothetical protein